MAFLSSAPWTVRDSQARNKWSSQPNRRSWSVYSGRYRPVDDAIVENGLRPASLTAADSPNIVSKPNSKPIVEFVRNTIDERFLPRWSGTMMVLSSASRNGDHRRTPTVRRWRSRRSVDGNRCQMMRSSSPSRRQRYRNCQRSSWRSIRSWTVRCSRRLRRYRRRPWGWRRREGYRRVGELEPSSQSVPERLKCAEGFDSRISIRLTTFRSTSLTFWSASSWGVWFSNRMILGHDKMFTFYVFFSKLYSSIQSNEV